MGGLKVVVKMALQNGRETGEKYQGLEKGIRISQIGGHFFFTTTVKKS